MALIAGFVLLSDYPLMLSWLEELPCYANVWYATDLLHYSAKLSQTSRMWPLDFTNLKWIVMLVVLHVAWRVAEFYHSTGVCLLAGSLELQGHGLVNIQDLWLSIVWCRICWLGRWLQVMHDWRTEAYCLMMIQLWIAQLAQTCFCCRWGYDAMLGLLTWLGVLLDCISYNWCIVSLHDL